MTRILPYPMISLAIIGLWLAVVSSFTWNSLVMAAIAGILLPLATRRFLADVPPVRRPLRAVQLFLRVCADIIAANWQVARQVLGPLDRLHPDFLTVPLSTRDPFVATMLGSIVSLTPGTVSIDIDLEAGTLFVHALDLPDPDTAIATIKARYEAPLMEVFGC